MVNSIDPTKWTPVKTWEKLFQTEQVRIACQKHLYRTEAILWDGINVQLFFRFCWGIHFQSEKYTIFCTQTSSEGTSSHKKKDHSLHSMMSGVMMSDVGSQNFGRSNFFDLLTAESTNLAIPNISGISALLQAPWTILDDWGKVSQLGVIWGSQGWPGTGKQLLGSGRPSKNSSNIWVNWRAGAIYLFFGGGCRVLRSHPLLKSWEAFWEVLPLNKLLLCEVHVIVLIPSGMVCCCSPCPSTSQSAPLARCRFIDLQNTHVYQNHTCPVSSGKLQENIIRQIHN